MSRYRASCGAVVASRSLLGERAVTGTRLHSQRCQVRLLPSSESRNSVWPLTYHSLQTRWLSANSLWLDHDDTEEHTTTRRRRRQKNGRYKAKTKSGTELGSFPWETQLVKVIKNMDQISSPDQNSSPLAMEQPQVHLVAANIQRLHAEGEYDEVCRVFKSAPALIEENLINFVCEQVLDSFRRKENGIEELIKFLGSGRAGPGRNTLIYACSVTGHYKDVIELFRSCSTKQWEQLSLGSLKSVILACAEVKDLEVLKIMLSMDFHGTPLRLESARTAAYCIKAAFACGDHAAGKSVFWEVRRVHLPTHRHFYYGVYGALLQLDDVKEFDYVWREMERDQIEPDALNWNAALYIHRFQKKEALAYSSVLVQKHRRTMDLGNYAVAIGRLRDDPENEQTAMDLFQDARKHHRPVITALARELHAMSEEEIDKEVEIVDSSNEWVPKELTTYRSKERNKRAVLRLYDRILNVCKASRKPEHIEEVLRCLNEDGMPLSPYVDLIIMSLQRAKLFQETISIAEKAVEGGWKLAPEACQSVCSAYLQTGSRNLNDFKGFLHGLVRKWEAKKQQRASGKSVDSVENEDSAKVSSRRWAETYAFKPITYEGQEEAERVSFVDNVLAGAIRILGFRRKLDAIPYVLKLRNQLIAEILSQPGPQSADTQVLSSLSTSTLSRSSGDITLAMAGDDNSKPDSSQDTHADTESTDSPTNTSSGMRNEEVLRMLEETTFPLVICEALTAAYGLGFSVQHAEAVIKAMEKAQIPCNDKIHRDLLCLYVAAGQHEKAIVLYDEILQGLKAGEVNPSRSARYKYTLENVVIAFEALGQWQRAFDVLKEYREKWGVTEDIYATKIGRFYFTRFGEKPPSIGS